MTKKPHRWTFLSNHAHVLLVLAQEPDARLRVVAERVGITERAAQSIVSKLEADGVLTRVREGRRNRYVLHLDSQLRHPVEAHRTIGDLVAMVQRDDIARDQGAASRDEFTPHDEVASSKRA